MRAGTLCRWRRGSRVLAAKYSLHLLLASDWDSNPSFVEFAQFSFEAYPLGVKFPEVVQATREVGTVPVLHRPEPGSHASGTNPAPSADRVRLQRGAELRGPGGSCYGKVTVAVVAKVALLL